MYTKDQIVARHAAARAPLLFDGRKVAILFKMVNTILRRLQSRDSWQEKGLL